MKGSSYLKTISVEEDQQDNGKNLIRTHRSSNATSAGSGSGSVIRSISSSDNKISINPITTTTVRNSLTKRKSDEEKQRQREIVHSLIEAERLNNANNNSVIFPVKLHALLEDAEKSGFKDIISWQGEGYSFKIYDTERYTNEIMPKYFDQCTKFKSFHRQLNIYGFKRIPLGPYKGGYAHSQFCRPDPQRCESMQRQTSRKGGGAGAGGGGGDTGTNNTKGNSSKKPLGKRKGNERETTMDSMSTSAWAVPFTSTDHADSFVDTCDVIDDDINKNIFDLDWTDGESRPLHIITENSSSSSLPSVSDTPLVSLSERSHYSQRKRTFEMMHVRHVSEYEDTQQQSYSPAAVARTITTLPSSSTTSISTAAARAMPRPVPPAPLLLLPKTRPAKKQCLPPRRLSSSPRRAVEQQREHHHKQGGAGLPPLDEAESTFLEDSMMLQPTATVMNRAFEGRQSFLDPVLGPGGSVDGYVADCLQTLLDDIDDDEDEDDGQQHRQVPVNSNVTKRNNSDNGWNDQYDGERRRTVQDSSSSPFASLFCGNANKNTYGNDDASRILEREIFEKSSPLLLNEAEDEKEKYSEYWNLETKANYYQNYSTQEREHDHHNQHQQQQQQQREEENYWWAQPYHLPQERRIQPPVAQQESSSSSWDYYHDQQHGQVPAIMHRHYDAATSPRYQQESQLVVDSYNHQDIPISSSTPQNVDTTIHSYDAEQNNQNESPSSQQEQNHLVLGSSVENQEDQERMLDETSFPFRLHTILMDAERGLGENSKHNKEFSSFASSFEHVVSWVDDGTAFQVHNRKAFVKYIMPNYFDQTKFESFRRQLNMYGFQRVSKGERRGIVSHPCFLKADRSLCRFMTRNVTSPSS